MRVAAEILQDGSRRQSALGREPHGELLERVRAGRQDHDLPIAVRSKAVRTAPDRRDEPGAHDRGLSTAGRPDDGEERRSREAAGEVGDKLLPPEEELSVLGLEGLEALVREPYLAAEGSVVGGLLVERARRGEVAPQPVDDELEQLLGMVEVLQEMLAQVT